MLSVIVRVQHFDVIKSNHLICNKHPVITIYKSLCIKPLYPRRFYVPAEIYEP